MSHKQAALVEDAFSEFQRAEDILLGTLGFAEEARIISVARTESGYAGVGQYSDGEQFEFSSDEGLDELETWALDQVARALKAR